MRVHILTISLCCLIFCGTVTAQVPRYANVTNDGQIVYAPAVLDMGPIFNGHAAPSGRTWKVFNAPASNYFEKGWYPVVTNAPTYTEYDKVPVDTGKWEIQSNTVVKVWRKAQRNIQLSKIKLRANLMGIGDDEITGWDFLKALMDDPDTGLQEIWDNAVVLDESDSDVQKILGVLKMRFGLSDSEMDYFIRSSESEIMVNPR